MKTNPSVQTRRRLVEAFEAAYRREEVAFDAALDAIHQKEMRSIGDAHPAGLDYLVAREGMWEASDKLGPLIAAVGAMAVRRGDVLYARVGASLSDRSERSSSDDSGRPAAFQAEREPETIDEQVMRIQGQATRVLRFDMGPNSDMVLTLPG